VAELKSVLGAILRDIVEARVASDLSSRDVGLEYLQDEILRNFPVPRVNLKEASIKLRFAVTATETTAAVDAPERVVRRVVDEQAATLSKAVADRVVEENPRKDALAEVTKRKRVNLAAVAEKAIVETLGEPAASERLARGDTTTVARALQEQLTAAFTADEEVAKVLVPTTRDRTLQTALNAAQKVVLEQVVSRIKAELSAAAKRPDVRVDLAVTREQLEAMPEAMISDISVVVEMRNQVWTEFQDDGAPPRQRLLPE